MFCAFHGPPKIVRLYGTGKVIRPGDQGFLELENLFPPLKGLRSFIRISCKRISDSCGFGVPLMDFQGNRRQLTDWAERKTPEQLRDYQREKNQESIDGLPAIPFPTEERS